MNELLQQFYAHTMMKDAVFDYLQETLKSYALERLFAHKDVTGIAEAKDVVDKAFIRLREEFEPITKNNNKPRR